MSNKCTCTSPNIFQSDNTCGTVAAHGTSFTSAKAGIDAKDIDALVTLANLAPQHGNASYAETKAMLDRADVLATAGITSSNAGKLLQIV